MKPTTLLALVALIVSSAAAIAEPLSDKSKAPDWGRASQAEKDAWITTAFQFKKPDADKAEVAACLDEHAARKLFETNALKGVTSMCETIAALPK
jgi:hypothetical protein